MREIPANVARPRRLPPIVAGPDTGGAWHPAAATLPPPAAADSTPSIAAGPPPAAAAGLPPPAAAVPPPLDATEPLMT